MKAKSQPMRVCVGCGEMRLKRELVRVVLSPTGEITIDTKGKAPGRGAYVEPNVNCLELAYKGKKLERSLKHAVSADVYEKLKSEIPNE